MRHEADTRPGRRGIRGDGAMTRPGTVTLAFHRLMHQKDTLTSQKGGFETRPYGDGGPMSLGAVEDDVALANQHDVGLAPLVGVAEVPGMLGALGLEPDTPVAPEHQVYHRLA